LSAQIGPEYGLFTTTRLRSYRIGPNYAQLPPNRAHSQVNSYARDGPIRYEPASWPKRAVSAAG
jgi:catalase